MKRRRGLSAPVVGQASRTRPQLLLMVFLVVVAVVVVVEEEEEEEEVAEVSVEVVECAERRRCISKERRRPISGEQGQEREQVELVKISMPSQSPRTHPQKQTRFRNHSFFFLSFLFSWDRKKEF